MKYNCLGPKWGANPFQRKSVAAVLTLISSFLLICAVLCLFTPVPSQAAVTGKHAVSVTPTSLPTPVTAITNYHRVITANYDAPLTFWNVWWHELWYYYTPGSEYLGATKLIDVAGVPASNKTEDYYTESGSTWYYACDTISGLTATTRTAVVNAYQTKAKSFLTAAEISYLSTFTYPVVNSNYTTAFIDLTTSTVMSAEADINCDLCVFSHLVSNVNTSNPGTYTIVDNKVMKTETISGQTVVTIYELLFGIATPLVLDLDDTGKPAVAESEWLPHFPKFYPQYVVNFDIDANGVNDLTEWLSPGTKDGLLCIPDENGKVRSNLDLFGNAGGYTDGYEKLSLICDKDNNGWVEGDELNGLMVWIDSNHDGVCQDNELRKVGEYNISRICCKHDKYVSKYETSDGKMHKMWDWWPTYAQYQRKIKIPKQ